MLRQVRQTARSSGSTCFPSLRTNVKYLKLLGQTQSLLFGAQFWGFFLLLIDLFIFLHMQTICSSSDLPQPMYSRPTGSGSPSLSNLRLSNCRTVQRPSGSRKLRRAATGAINTSKEPLRIWCELPSLTDDVILQNLQLCSSGPSKDS